MGTSSIFKLAEKCKDILGKGDLQALISSCQDAYGIVVKNEWFANMADGSSEIDGTFISTFKNIEPILDLDVDQYFIIIPSSYLRLPHEIGINAVSTMKGQSFPFVRINSGSLGTWNNLKSFMFNPYYVEGVRMYFPKMKATSVQNILLKLAVALDEVDVDENLNIPPNVAAMIVDMVVAKYQNKPEVKPDTLQ